MNMTTKPNNQIKAAWIGGACVIIAAVAGAIIALHPWSSKSTRLKAESRVYSISGTVVDDKTNESIEQAEINIIGRNETTTTERSGNFNITIQDSLSSIRVRVTKPGYKSVDLSTIVPNNNLIVQLMHE